MRSKLLDSQTLRPWTESDNWSNAKFILFDYLSLALVIGSVVAAMEWLGRSSWSWLASAPLILLTIVLVGALQHRLACLAHEAAH